MGKTAKLAVVTGALVALWPLATVGAIGGVPTAVAAVNKGGNVTFLAVGDVGSLDPGQTHTSFGLMVLYATNRTLYSYKPGGVKPVPDLATGLPVVSNGGKRITVHIKSGIHYSPPLQNVVVTTSDIKYAFERAFSTHVPNAYAEADFGSIVGAPSAPTTSILQIPGIVTPSVTTIVFNLSVPDAAEVTSALVLPITVPVPESYASKYDQGTPTTYGEHAVYTGPYMVKSYTPSQDIQLVRNPSWDAKTDYRPAYLDSITVKEGEADVAATSMSVLSGSSLICCDTGRLPPSVLSLALEHDRSQLVLAQSHATLWTAFNTTMAPLQNLNVRKAIIAAVNRHALWELEGGAAGGELASGYIPPGPGFAAARGAKQGAGLDFMANAKGDMKLARRYMRAAKAQGMTDINAAGMYSGPELVAVTSDVGPDQEAADLVQRELVKLGFRLKLVDASEVALYNTYCGSPATLRTDMVAMCMDVTSFEGYPDPQSLLMPTFDGNDILPQGNLNWSQLNDPALDVAMSGAALLTGSKRLRAWAKVNDMIGAEAPGIPYLWYKTATVASKNVELVVNGYYAAADLSFTSVRS
ncbi:MAG TPA: ABC transporter substrate-binding protein [Acidimicrobiales bacterium]|nr:ABC transporter substrate-binding protein [Acidimicrobiales bacterium]